MINLFNFNEGKLTLAQDAVVSLPEFSELARRYKDDGDMLFKVFLYIWYRGHYQSPFALLDAQLQHSKAVKACKLAANYMPDEYVKLSIKAYQQYQIDCWPTILFFTELLKGIKLSAQVVSIVVKSMENRLQTIKETNIVATEDIDFLVSSISKLMKLGQDLKTSLSSMGEMGIQLRAEQSGVTLNLRGGRGKGRYEDEDEDIGVIQKT